MSSNEEYLDNLLKSLSDHGDNDAPDSMESEDAEDEGMSVDDILGILNSGDEDSGEIPELSVDDLLSGLNTSDEVSAGEADTTAAPASNNTGDADIEAALAAAGAGNNGDDRPADVDVSDMDALLKAASGREESQVPAIQDVMQMSEDDIAQLLSSTEKTAAENAPAGDDGDLSELLGNARGDDDLQEIDSLLKKSDNNEAVDEDMLALLQGISGGGEQEPAKAGEDTPQETPREAKARKAAEKKAEKEARKAAQKAARLEKKNKKKQAGEPTEESPAAEEPAMAGESAMENISQADHMTETEGLGDHGIDPSMFFTGEEEPASDMEADQDPSSERKKKKGFFSKLMELMTEEDEEEDEEAQSLNLTDENKNILKEMKNEDKEGGKKKGKAKKKKAKQAQEEPGEGEEGAPAGKKGKKGKKDKKAKKSGKQKSEDGAAAQDTLPQELEDQKPEKKLSGKRVGLIAAICLSFAAALLVFIHLSGDYADRRIAREAFYQENYQECYKNLFGKELDESEQVMFFKSETILRMRLHVREYEYLTAQGKPVEALDSLIQTVYDYAALYEYAVRWNAGQEVQDMYGKILEALQTGYGLTEAQALEIAAEPDDVEYTRICYAIAGGSEYASWRDETEMAKLPDMLPEEEELPAVSFVEGEQ